MKYGNNSRERISGDRDYRTHVSDWNESNDVSKTVVK